jgi:predicted RNA-binding Zn-ribbon protein involved in translation (DUF1610 family)
MKLATIQCIGCGAELKRSARARYLSGLYVCLREDEFEQWAEWALI